MLNYLVPSKDYFVSKSKLPVPKGNMGGKGVKAAFIDAKPGIYFDVSNLDFASLYPTAIASKNISYETIACEHPECKKNIVPEHTWHICLKKKGIQSLYVGALRNVRVKFRYEGTKDKIAKTKAQALKMVLLTLWGAVSSEYFEYFMLAEASAITGYSRFGIEGAKSMSIESGFDDVYTHTDSLFLVKTPSVKMTPKELAVKLTEKLGFDIDVDKELKLLIVHAKANAVEVMKDGTVDIVGLMIKKRHMPMVIRQASDEVCEILGRVNSPTDIDLAKIEIKKVVAKFENVIKSGEIDKRKLAYRVKISQDSGSGQDYDVVAEYRRRGVNKRSGEYILKVLKKGHPTACPMEFIRTSEINFDKYVDVLYSTLDPILTPLGLSRVVMSHKGSIFE